MSDEVLIYELTQKAKAAEAIQIALKECEKKLNIANCNCRALEEENADLHSLIKELQDKHEIPHFNYPRPAVRVLILENEELKSRVLNFESQRTSEKDEYQNVCLMLRDEIKTLNDRIGELLEEKDHILFELNNARSRLAEATAVLEEERSARESAEVLWEQERKKYSDKIKEFLLMDNMQDTVVNMFSESGTIDDRSDIDNLLASNYLTIIKEMQNKLRSAEQEVALLHKLIPITSSPSSSTACSPLENDEKAKIFGNTYAAKDEPQDEEEGSHSAYDKHVVGNLAANEEYKFVRSLQEEIAKLNKELNNVRCELGEEKEKNKKLTVAHLNQQNDVVLPIHTTSASFHLSNSTPFEDTNRFYSEVHNFKTKILQLQSSLDEKEVYCKELEAKLTSLSIFEENNGDCNPFAQSNTDDERSVENFKGVSAKTHPSSNKDNSKTSYREVNVHHSNGKNLQNQILSETHGEQLHKEEQKKSQTHSEQSVKLHNLERTEQQREEEKIISSLNEEINRLVQANAQKDIINAQRIKEMRENTEKLMCDVEELREKLQTAEVKLNDKEKAEEKSSESSLQVLLPHTTSKILNDKKRCVEEVMDALEMAWLDAERAKEQLNQIPYETAIMANQDALREEECNRLQSALLEAENKAKDIAEMEDKIHDLERIAYQRSNKIHDMKSIIEDCDRTQSKQRREKEVLQNKISALSDENGRLMREIDALHAQRNPNQTVKSPVNEVEHNRLKALEQELCDLREKNEAMEEQLAKLTTVSPSRSSRVSGQRATQSSIVQPVMVRRTLSSFSAHSSTEDIKRSAVPEGAHLTVTIVELSNIMHNAKAITEPGYVVIKLKSIKEKYKTSIKELAPSICFGETFVFYLAQPDQDVITLHVFYKAKNNSREFHVGDACFSMATLYRGVPRQRIAPVVQNPGSRDAMRAAQIDVILQTDDFGRSIIPAAADLEDEQLRFNEMVHRLESGAVEKLHAADVYMASTELQEGITQFT